MIRLRINIPIQAKQSTRFGNGRAFADPKKVKYQKDVKRQVLDAFKGDVFAKDTPISMGVLFNFPLRKKDKKPNWHTQRPDTLNIIKAIEDAMSEIVYEDDNQICLYEKIGKIRRGSEPYILITLKEIKENPEEVFKEELER